MTPEQLTIYRLLFEKITSKNLRGQEDILSNNIAVWLRNEVLDGLPIVFFHVPNEGKRSITYAMRTNAIGLIPGAPDFVISSNNKTIFLELKAPGKKNRLSENQKAFKAWSDDVGIPYHVVDNVPEAKKIFYKEFSGIRDFSVLGD